MQNTAGPGDIPEWKVLVVALSPAQRVAFAESIGVTERTVKNWADGKTMPNERVVQRIVKTQRRGKK